jgi:DNA polymerase III delta subunit
MKKTEVYSWRVAFDLKQTLEEAAKAEKVSLAQLLERIVSDWLNRRPQADDPEEAVQQKLHQSASQAFGTIRGGDPNRSQEVSGRMKSKLRERLASQRPD